jgi:predicted TIM-barrel fold metal-dependent hydrolase
MSESDISRRQFQQAALTAGVAAIAAAGTARVAQAAPPKNKYIDMHTHVGTFYYGKPLLADELVRMMDKHGIEKACVLPLVSPESTPYLQTSEGALEAAKAHPDRLIAFCCLDARVSTTNPSRYGHVTGARGMIEILDRYKQAGARGFGEHKVGLPFDHLQMMAVYEACDKLSLPILFHLDDLRGIDTPGLPRLENVLKAFPNLPLIGHAAGFWASISGDATFADFGRYPEIPKPTEPGGALDRLMEKYPNLYGDLSEPGGEKAITRDPKFGREFIIRNAKQLVFGTDFLMGGQEVPQFELLDSLNLPEDVQAKIYRDNAKRLLKLN